MKITIDNLDSKDELILLIQKNRKKYLIYTIHDDSKNIVLLDISNKKLVYYICRLKIDDDILLNHNVYSLINKILYEDIDSDLKIPISTLNKSNDFGRCIYKTYNIILNKYLIK